MRMVAQTRARRRQAGLLDETPRCSRCDGPNERAPQRYCGRCHAAYMQGWRKGEIKSDETKRRDSARAYAREYRKRGYIEKTGCVICGSPESEMHHPDHNKPLEIVHLCRRHHLEWHAQERADPKTPFDEWLTGFSTVSYETFSSTRETERATAAFAKEFPAAPEAVGRAT